jgi:hypothetical protein
MEIREAALARDIPRASQLLSQHIDLTARGFELWFQQSGLVEAAQS